MVSRIESSETRPTFKKRSLRPWKPVIELEQPLNTDSKVAFNLFENDLTTEFPLELLHKPLETGAKLENQLENQIKKQEEIRGKLSNLDNNRLTLGGFFKPKNVLFLDEKESSEQTFFLLNALKDKEHEIVEINHQLKLTEMIEEIQHSTLALHSEKTARSAAEERIISTQRQVQQLVEQSQALEEKLSLSEQAKNQLEYRTLHLEKTLTEARQNFEAQLHTLSSGSEKLQDSKQLEINLRKQTEEELKLVKIQRQTLEKELHAKNQAYQDLQSLSEESQTEIQRLTLKRRTIENDLRLTSEKLEQTEQALMSEKANIQILESQYKRIQEEQRSLCADTQSLEGQLAQERSAFQEKVAPMIEHMKKMNNILQGERNLRQHLETKTRDLAGQIFNLELRIQTEEYARKLAEQKAKMTITRASEAVLNVLNNSENTAITETTETIETTEIMEELIAEK